MKIIHLSNCTIADGRLAFDLYANGALCGARSYAYQTSLERETGLHVLAGAIVACIERGLDTRDEIVDAAARASRCRRSTAEAMLDALDGGDPDLHLWTSRGCEYSLLKRGSKRVPVVLAA